MSNSMKEHLARVIEESAHQTPLRLAEAVLREMLFGLTPAMRKEGEDEMRARHTNLDCYNDPYFDSAFAKAIQAAIDE